MKLFSLTIENFRAYHEPTTVYFQDFTVIIGKNDVGKSTIFEALNIFFGNQLPDEKDLNIKGFGLDQKTKLTVEFYELPDKINLDSGATTTLQSEYLVNSSGRLQVMKEFISLKSPKVYLIANHPSNDEINDLHSLKITALKERATKRQVPEGYNKGIKNDIRKAIWAASQEQLEFHEMQLKSDEDGIKDIWENLEKQMPYFALFKSDRENLDSDSYIQDPMKFVTKEIIKSLDGELEKIRKIVDDRIREVAAKTIEKVHEMNPEIASDLQPKIPMPAWEKVFNISLECDHIPLNKRGSGVRRLVLINFFRQEAERRRNLKGTTGVIYAIEEPETSQHPDWQLKLVDALIELSEIPNTQLLVSTHSAALASRTELKNINYISRDNTGRRLIDIANENNFEEIASSLGILPDPFNKNITDLQLILCFEGPHDVTFFSSIFRLFDINIVDDPRILAIPLGGETLKHWVAKNYLNKINIPQIHIYDNDVPSYHKYIDEINSKNDQSWATLTNLNAIENYIHPSLIRPFYKYSGDDFIDLTQDNWQELWGKINISKELSEFLKQKKANGDTKINGEGPNSIKKMFAVNLSPKLDMELLSEIGVINEVEEWVTKIKEKIH